MTTDEAISTAQDALVWLAGQPEAMAGFLAASGLAPETLRQRISDPEFLGFVLEFLLGSDWMLLDFAAVTGRTPEAPARARAVLPGGGLPNWT